MNPKTQVGQQVLRYLQEHPDETSPSKVAKATGCTRPTARAYIAEWQIHRKDLPPQVEKLVEKLPSTDQAAAAVTDLPVAKPARSFAKDFPPKPKPKPAAKPAPAPPQTLSEVVEDLVGDDVDEDQDDEEGWL